MSASSIAPRLLVLSLLAVSAPAFAQNSDSSWEKSYPVSDKPALDLRSSDAALDVRACEGCHAVHIHVISKNVSLALYTISETQVGNTIHFELKEKSKSGFHMHWNGEPHYVRVQVETPADLKLQAHTSDGSIALHGLHGDLDSSTSDGAQSLEDVAGTVKLHSSDGSLNVQQRSGTLDASTADGSISVQGALSGVKLNSSNGSIQLRLADGSRLTQPAEISASDGSVSVQLPRNFPSNIDLSAADGSIHADLELASADSGERSSHHVAGKLDGGGPPFTVRTSSGSVHVSR